MGLHKRCQSVGAIMGKFQIKHSITTKCWFGAKVPVFLLIHRDGFKWKAFKIGQQLQTGGLRPRTSSCFSSYPRPCNHEPIIDLSSNLASSFLQKARLQVSTPLFHWGILPDCTRDPSPKWGHVQKVFCIWITEQKKPYNHAHSRS